jgi:hypothetical protein
MSLAPNEYTLNIRRNQEGPFKDALDRLPTQGVFQHSLVTYRYHSGQLIKETIVRTYSSNGDYTDGIKSEPIGKGSSV